MQRKKVDVVLCGGGWTGPSTTMERTTRSTAEYANNMDEVAYSLRLRLIQTSAE